MEASDIGFCNVLKEKTKGCLRFRVYEFRINDGSVRHGVEMVAWNSWAGQAKLLDFVGGIDRKTAVDLFDWSVRHYATFDWMTGDCVPETAQ